MAHPNPGFDIAFVDESDPSLRTERVHVPVGDEIDSSMPEATANAIADSINRCEHATPVTVKRLGGLAGSKTIPGCGAFPAQRPDKVIVAPYVSDWFDPSDF
jgi:hypothetical protein